MRYLIIIALGISLLGAKPKKDEAKSARECEPICQRALEDEQLRCLLYHRFDPNVQSICNLVINNQFKNCLLDCEGQS